MIHGFTSVILDPIDCMATAVSVVQTIGLFIAAGIAEIGGGWLVYQFFRSNKSTQYHIWYYLFCGFLVILVYPVIPCFQPDALTFGRIYAVYGGFFYYIIIIMGLGIRSQ